MKIQRLISLVVSRPFDSRPGQGRVSLSRLHSTGVLDGAIGLSVELHNR